MYKTQIDKNSLLSKLQQVSAGIAQTELIEQTSCVILKGNNIASFNDTICIRASGDEENEVFDFPEMAIPFNKLSNTLKSFKNSEMEMLVGENTVVLKEPGCRVEIRIEKEIKIPIDEIELPTTFKKLPSDFTEGLQQVIPSASDNTIQGILYCIHCANGVVESCDNFRFSRYITESKFNADFLLPKQVVRHLIKMPIQSYNIGKNWYHFKTQEGTVFSARKVTGTYPNIDKLIKKNIKSKTIDFPEKVLEMIERSAIFSESDFEHESLISVSVDRNKIGIQAKDEGGRINLLHKGKNPYASSYVSFSIHPNLLGEILSHINKALLFENAIVFKDKNFYHSICIRRREGEEK